MMMRWICAAAIAGVMMAAPTTVQAAGAGGNNFPKPKPARVCKKKGWVFCASVRRCTRKKHCRTLSKPRRRNNLKKRTGLETDRMYVEQGWQLAYAGRPADAIAAFDMVTDKARPRLLNGLGYAHRKLGAMDTAISYYRAAIALAPNYVLAREYLGEGYVTLGRLDLARVQLNEIRERCGGPCQPWRELSAVIAHTERQL